MQHRRQPFGHTQDGRASPRVGRHLGLTGQDTSQGLEQRLGQPCTGHGVTLGITASVACNELLDHTVLVGMEADHGQAPASGQAPQGNVQDPRELAAFVIGVNP